MTTFGVTREGIVIKTIQDVLQEIEDNQKILFGSGFTVAPDSPQGQLNGVFGDKVAELWELLLDVARTRQPSFASGAHLDEILALTGTRRLPATNSRAQVELIRTGGTTTVPVTTILSIGSGGSQWQVTEETDVADGAFVPVEAVESGPVFAGSGTIDSFVTPLVDLQERPFVKSLNNGPFKLFDYDFLTVQIDSDETKTIEFRSSDFSDISSATLSEVLAVIAAAFGSMESEVLSQGYLLWSATLGPGSAIEVQAGILERLGLSPQRKRGFNRSTRGSLTSGNTGPYDLTGNPNFFIKANGGASQIVLFDLNSYGEKARATIDAVAGSDITSGVDTETFVIDDGSGPVTFVFDDDASVTQTLTLRPIAFSGGETRIQMAQKIRSAISSAGLAITVRAALDSGITLLTTVASGVATNIALTDTVANAGFVVTGFVGGANGTVAAVPAHRVAEAINEQTVNLFAFESSGKIVIESSVDGVNGSVEITGGTANTAFGFPINDEQAGRGGESLLGRNVETDAEARARRSRVIRAPGGGSVLSIQAAISTLPEVSYARVYENPLNVIDSSGRPPKCIEAVVLGGVDNDIAEVIREKKAGGIQAYAVPGSNGVTVILQDDDTNDFTIGFSRPDQVQLYVEVHVQVQRGTFGGGVQALGEQAVRESIKAIIDALFIGNDVSALALKCAPLFVAGVKDVSYLAVDTIFTPVNTNNLVISDRSLATLLTTDVVVNVTFL